MTTAVANSFRPAVTSQPSWRHGRHDVTAQRCLKCGHFVKQVFGPDRRPRGSSPREASDDLPTRPLCPQYRRLVIVPCATCHGASERGNGPGPPASRSLWTPCVPALCALHCVSVCSCGHYARVCVWVPVCRSVSASSGARGAGRLSSRREPACPDRDRVLSVPPG